MCRELRLQVEELREENADLARLKGRVAGLNQQIESVSRARDDAQQEGLRLAGLHAALRDDMSKCHVALEAGKEEIRQLQSQIAVLKNELIVQKAELGKLQVSIIDKDSIIEQLRESKKLEISMCERRIDELEGQLSTHTRHLSSTSRAGEFRWPARPKT
jgi:chromosome segregation ATPase